MSGSPSLVLKFAVGVLLPAALLLWLVLNVGGPERLRDGVDVLSCLPDPDPNACIQRALTAPPATPEFSR